MKQGGRIRSTLVFLLLSGVVAAAAYSQSTVSARWVEGRHYHKLDAVESSASDGGKIQVAEFFDYGCPHCAALEPTLQRWSDNKPDYIELIRVPTPYTPLMRAHARLYYTLRALSREDLHPEVYRALHEEKIKLFVPDDDQATENLLLSFSERHGIRRDSFLKAYRSAAVAAKIERARALALKYKVAGVPAVMVDAKYVTSVGEAGGADELMSLIATLAESERRSLHTSAQVIGPNSAAR